MDFLSSHSQTPKLGLSVLTVAEISENRSREHSLTQEVFDENKIKRSR
jgi:hypothetical protein